MPLAYYPPGKPAIVKRIGGKNDTKRFLGSLGFSPGAHVTVVSENGGNMIVNVKDCRVALDKTLARRILV